MYNYDRLKTSPPTQLSNINVIIEKNAIIKKYHKIFIIYNTIFILQGVYLIMRLILL